MEIVQQVKFDELIEERGMRREMAKTFLGFMLVYMAHYLTLEPAEFHPEMIQDLSNGKMRFLSYTGFRGCAKSALVLGFILWSALENYKETPFIVPVNDTDDIARMTIANIREELEHNVLIIKDYGDIMDKVQQSRFSKMSETNILFTNGVRIMARSRGQKIRGLRHRQHRVKLLVMDDIEERKKVNSKKYRDETEAWLTSDIIPAIDELNGRLVLLGNLLHSDAIMARVKKFPLFICKDFPLFKKGTEPVWENCTWKAKYPTPLSLVEQEKAVGHMSWLREYCLKVIPPEGQEVKEEWIKRYTTLPSVINKSGVGVDLAISKAQTADYTTMVSAVASIEQGIPHIYILPNPINARLSFHETIQQMKSVAMAMKIHATPTFYVENVAYQKAAIEEARRDMLVVKEIKPGADKRARLRAAATFIQNGTVVFPEHGCEALIDQILGFGVEDHDDLVDAFVYIVLGMAEEGLQKFEVVRIL